MYFFYFYCIGRSISVDFGTLTSRVFTEYSQSIRRVFICIGYVSVIFRLTIGAYSKEVGSYSN